MAEPEARLALGAHVYEVGGRSLIHAQERVSNRRSQCSVHAVTSFEPYGETRPRHVTVVIVTYQSAGVLPECLASLPLGMEGVEDWTIAIADNGSDDGALDLARELLPGVATVQLGRNAGYAAGINAAISAASPPDAVLVINPDIRLRQGAVALLLGALHDPRVGIAVPRIIGPNGSLHFSLRRQPAVLRALGEALLGGRRAGRYAALGETVTRPTEYEAAHTVAWATGASLLISRRCREIVGPWDESFFLYSEETDYQLRAGDFGFGVEYIPESEVIHIGGDLSRSPQLWALRTTNQAALFARRHGRFRSGAFRAILILNQAVRAARGSRTHRAALRSMLSGGGGTVARGACRS
jgi:N-acetylglucosaminyl-diphospho-decaprenol L-rhamnosyltransferase